MIFVHFFPGSFRILQSGDTRSSPSPGLYRLITYKFEVTQGLGTSFRVDPSYRPTSVCPPHHTATQARTCQGHRPTLASSAWSLPCVLSRYRQTHQCVELIVGKVHEELKLRVHSVGRDMHCSAHYVYIPHEPKLLSCVFTDILSSLR